LHKAGWSIRKLSAHHGYKSPGTLTHALNRHWPKGERLIAAALGIDPATIWPSRYPQDTATVDSRQTGRRAA
jgi:Ner family transcriptional regulator